MAGRKILIVEDEPIHLNVMKAKLELEGYAVVAAKDGEEGYRMIKSENPDLVLLDIILPKMDGFEIMEKLRKDKSIVPIVIVSNSGQPVEIDRAMNLGARDYLVKAEFNPQDVLEKVVKILGKAPPQPAARNSTEKNAGVGLAAAGKTTHPEFAARRASILIVEDDKFLRDLLSQKLKREGFNTIDAIDGEEGLKLAKEKNPDLILLDIILPSLDGFEVLKRLKSDKSTSAVPVIVLSNLGQKEDMEKAISGGAEDFMVKAHFTPGEIVARIKSVLKKKYF